MNLWVDNSCRPPDGWVWAQTSSGAIDALCFGMVERLSLGDELGGDDTTRPVIRWMRENSVWPKDIRVHCANRVCAEWLIGMIDRYRK
ncbi:cyclic-phosphate processing receiver domain-containing protein [Rhodococcus sp. NPDC056743]|uniref:cyclic-phosphate processing receiver domain-containing protein n=1 Tax=Rhodococcus sp. NPDC056743 TaxID=3345934 RepID=UPI00366C0151